MRLLMLIVLAFLMVERSYGQSVENIDIAYKTRNVIWGTPVSKNTKINGVAIGFLTVPMFEAELLVINGLNIEASPFAVFGGVFAIVGTILSPFDFLTKHKSAPDSSGFRDFFPYFTDSISGRSLTAINGLSISTGLSRIDNLRGIGINALTSFPDEVKGLEVTGIMNFHYSFKGVIIAGFRNKTTTGEGLQIGLFNSCKEGKVVQIGLLNRIGNVTTPIININLRN